MPVLVRDLGYSASLVGIILAVSEGAGLMGPFLIGRFADKYGKYKWSISLSVILSGAPALPLALFGRPVLSVIFIAIIGIGYRSSTPLVEAITTINVGKTGNYGRIRIFGSIAYVVFALFMQWIPVLKPDSALNIALWLTIASVFALTVISFLPLKSVAVQSSNEKTLTGGTPNTTTKKITMTPFLILGLICISLSRLAMAPVYSFLPLFLVEYMHWNAIGLMSALATAAEIPFMYISHSLIRRFGAMPIIAFASAMVVLRLLLYAVFPFKAGVIIAQLLHSFCFGLFHPAAITFISGCVPPEQRSFGMALYMSFGNGLPLLIGNFLGGFIVEHFGFRFLFGSFTAFPILGLLAYFIGHIKGPFKADS